MSERERLVKLLRSESDCKSNRRIERHARNDMGKVNQTNSRIFSRKARRADGSCV